MRDDTEKENAEAAPATVIEPRLRAEIEAAILALPILPKEEWQVRHIVDDLCLRAAILSASKGDGRVTPHFRPATRQTTLKELNELERQMSGLARKLERGVRTKRARERFNRARERLARLVKGLHAPTTVALSCAPALMVGGRPILADINYFENQLPNKLLADGSDLSALEMRYWGKLARLAGIEAAKAQAVADEAASDDPIDDVFVMFPSLVRLQPDEPRYADDAPGRPPNQQVHAIARLICSAYQQLTGHEPIFGHGKSGPDAPNVHGPFIDFSREVFAIMGIPHDALRYVSVAAYARRGRGRKQ